MATVFLAHDEKHDREVAIKILHADVAEALGAERFLHEIKVTATLQHPHILGLIDSGLIGEGELKGRPYYVMPYVEGESVRERLHREQQLPVADAVRIATEAASALDYAHRHGVIHRDIKPENILLHDGSAMVADFGIALAAWRAAGKRLTEPGVSVGTPAYMSPEQATGERSLTPASDIYSLGVVTYEMLSGDPPFTGANPRAIVARLMTEEPRPLGSVRRSIPAHVTMAVSRALEKVPADRFASAHEFAEALNNPALMSTASMLTTPGGRGRWLRPLIYGVVGLLILLAVTAVWSLKRPATPREVLRYDLTFDTTEAIEAGGSYVTRLAISPDGSRWAYIGGPRAQLLIRPRNQLHATAIPATEGTVSPFFSPDGRRVGVQTEGGLRVLSLSGGEPIMLTDERMGVAGASWGRDGFIYVDGRGLASLLRVEAKPGAVPKGFTALDTANGEIDHTWPDVLPNGKGVLFTLTRTAKSTADIGRTYYIAVAEVPSGKHRILVNDAMYARYSASGHMLYVTTDRKLMVVPFDQESMKVVGEATALVEGMRLGSFGSADLAVSSNGTLVYGTGGGQGKPELAWVTREGKSQSMDSTWLGFFWDPAISPDGKRLAVMQNLDGGATIWIKQLDHGPPVRLALESDNDRLPTWTPDGKSVTFSSAAGGSPGLWTMRADGSSKAALQYRERRGAIESRWSPDGKWLVFATFKASPGSGDILGIRPSMDTLSVPLVATRFTESSPDLSPDGRWLTYTSDESGRDEVYVVPFPNTNAAKWLVSTRGGTEPVWSHSGRELFYRDGDANLVAAAVRSNPTFSVGSVAVLFSAAGFRAGGGAQYSVSPDDRRFLMIRRSFASTAEKLVVVENWFEELKAKSRK